MRDMLDGKLPPSPNEKSEPRSAKRKSDAAPPTETPVKRAKHIETPSKNRLQEDDGQNTPGISRKLFSPTSVTSLGPTPQRDGHVLGIFDLLPEGDMGTPSKHEDSAIAQLFATPTKKRTTFDVDDTPKLGRTPMSTSKRQMLNTFMTPLKNKDGNLTKTPSKMQFDTPQFLKRHSGLPAVDENGDFDAPAPLKLPRKPLGRGLSEIVAGLRKVEEEQLDEELEALRDLEREEMGMANPRPPQPKPKPTMAEEELLAKDSQVLLGGFDDEGANDSAGEQQVGRDGQPLKIYKKKGQKRTTRKVNIKPTWAKRPTESNNNNNEASDDDFIPETQAQGEEALGADVDVGSDSEFEGGKAKKTNSKTKEKAKSKKQGSKKEGTVKKAARKVNELAHANFQKLKLKNNGAKGGPGYNSRFRRRR